VPELPRAAGEEHARPVGTIGERDQYGGVPGAGELGQHRPVVFGNRSEEPVEIG